MWGCKFFICDKLLWFDGEGVDVCFYVINEEGLIDVGVNELVICVWLFVGV